MPLKKVFNTENLIWVLTVCLVASFYIFEASLWGGAVLFAVTIAVFLLDELQKCGKVRIRFEKYFFYVLAFVVYCLLSALWAWNGVYAFEKAFTIVKILVCTFVFYLHYSEKDSVLPLLRAVLWAGNAVALYSIAYYGVGQIIAVLAADGRLDSSFANVNSIAMIVANSMLITVFDTFFIKDKFAWKLLRLIMLIPAIVVIAAMGSRKALVMVAMGTVLLLFWRVKSKNAVETLLRWVVLALFLLLAGIIILSLPMFDGIKERMVGLIAAIMGNGEIDSSTQLRIDYMIVGLKQFFKTPLFGIGIGNSGLLLMQELGRDTYLHNNYVELLATGGIFGLLIFYSMYCYCIVNLIRYRKKANTFSVICAVLIFIQMIMDFGSVSYYSKSTFFFLMVFFIHIQILKRRERKKINENVSLDKSRG